jgi:hypothetical protein
MCLSSYNYLYEEILIIGISCIFYVDWLVCIRTECNMKVHKYIEYCEL